MSRASRQGDLKRGRLSSAEYARIWDHRLPARKQDLRRVSKSRATKRKKGTRGHTDPTALAAIRRVMHTNASEGW